MKKNKNYQHYELKEQDSAYLVFGEYLIILDFFPGEPRVQVEDDEGELVQELNFNKQEGEFG